MAAPKGNKYGIGSLNTGRPTKFDKKEEAEELLKWASQNDALVLRMFAPLRGYSTETLYRWVDEDEGFRHAYHIARDMIGARREMLYVEKINIAPFQRYATLYDEKLLKHERTEKEFDASLSKPSANELNPEDKDQFVKFMSVMSNVQSSALKIDDISNKDEAKS